MAGGVVSLPCHVMVINTSWYMKRDERRKATAVSTIEGRVVDGVRRVWMQGGAVIILHLCCRGRRVALL
jgi:hypothetical protein